MADEHNPKTMRWLQRQGASEFELVVWGWLEPAAQWAATVLIDEQDMTVDEALEAAANAQLSLSEGRS
jgi:hypothetical protein